MQQRFDHIVLDVVLAMNRCINVQIYKNHPFQLERQFLKTSKNFASFLSVSCHFHRRLQFSFTAIFESTAKSVDNQILLAYMKIVLFSVLLTVFGCGQTFNCSNYLLYLASLSQSDPSAYLQEMASYLLLSGKDVDDMGLPNTCTKKSAYNYWNLEMEVIPESSSTTLTLFYGFCFTSQCTTQDLNLLAGFIPNQLLQNTSYSLESFAYYDVNMSAQVTTGSVILCVAITLVILLRLVDSMQLWAKMCHSSNQNEAEQIELEDGSAQFALQGDQEVSQIRHRGFFELLSLRKAMSRLLEPIQSDKIMGFSLFKLFSIPLIGYGYLFYLTNFGAQNYYAFQYQIYESFYSCIATFVYYIPDIFFFISGYLLAKKFIAIDRSSDQKLKEVWKTVAIRLLKLYPLYVTFILIYWLVSPTLHSGPLWVPYNQQVGQCSSSWWRSFVLIDNWFTPGCFSFLWYPQVEVQLMLLLGIIFAIYAFKRIAANVLLSILYLASFITLFFPGAQLPHSVQSTISPGSILYFQAFYSHVFFYLSGVLIAFALDMQSVLSFFREHFLQSRALFSGSLVVAFTSLIFIVARPYLWEGGLKLQLAFCRIGIMLCFLVLFLDGMVNQQKHVSYIHKLAEMSYGIIMGVGLVTVCGFWGLQNFMYVSGTSLLKGMIPNVLIAIPVGILLQLTFDLTPLLQYRD